MQTLKASESGKILIKESRMRKIEQARTKRIGLQGIIERAWDMDEIFLREASKILEPDQNWDNSQTFAVALATWKRFREAKQPIRADTFKAFCQVLDLEWENVVENDVESRRNISEAPDLSSFSGRTAELAELQQWLIKNGCRLVVVHGMGGIGKSALARRLVNQIADKYDYIIWLSLASSPPFSEVLLKLGQFLSKGEKEPDDITQIMQYLHHQRCLIVLDGWEEITGNQSTDYINYSTFVERVATEAHRSSLILLSRKVTHDIAILKGQLVRFKKLGGLEYEEARQIFRSEGISGTDIELEKLSKDYSNPWMIKVIAQQVKTVFPDYLPPFIIDRSVFNTARLRKMGSKIKRKVF
ncbi:NB-ARC domain-containing protein, partial [Nodularia spumigena]|uniref:NB-ARC domain-containing protein n=1 Tax=Nodularia spumigena TaxID=70799 RepID=UPI002B20CD8E